MIRYNSAVAIQSFCTRGIERFFKQGDVPKGAGWAAVSRVAARKLDMLDFAEDIMDIASPPGNRLETLKGKRAGFYSIRINERWRIVFRWSPAGPRDVDIVDYH